MFNFFSKSQPEERERYFEKYEYAEYLEEGGGTSSNVLDKTDFRINMTDKDLVTLPSDSFLHVRFQITDMDKEVIDVGRIAPVNNGWNLFSRAKYLINDEIVDDINRPGYVKQVKGLIEYSDDYSRGQGKDELWSPDRVTGTVDSALQIYARNVTDPDAAVYPVTLTGVAPHVVQINGGAAAGYADGHVIQLFVRTANGDLEINAFRQATGATALIPIALLSNGVTGASIDYAGIGNNDNVTLIANGFTVYGFGNGGAGAFTANITPVLVLTDGNANAGNLFTEIGIDEYSANVGFNERESRGLAPGRKSRFYSVWMPLRQLFPFLKQNPVLMKGITQTLEFDRNDFAKMLIADSVVPPLARVVFHRIAWWVPNVKPIPSLNAKLIEFLNSGEQRRLMWDSIQHYRSEPFTNQEQSWLIKTTSHRPVKCIVFFQLNKRFNSQTENNMIFDNMDVSRISLDLNGATTFPHKEYVLNFGITDPTKEDYIRAYAAYLTACSAIHSDDCRPCVSYDEFKTLYTMFIFDMSSMDEGIFETTTEARLTLNYQFATTPLEAYRIHAVLETESDIVLSGINGALTKVR